MRVRPEQPTSSQGQPYLSSTPFFLVYTPLRLLGHGARGLESMEAETSEWEGG